MGNTMGRIVLHSLFRRWKMILGLGAGIFGTVVIGSLLWPPVYEATSSVIVQGRDYQQLLFPEPQAGKQWTVLTNPKEEINTEIAIIQSRPVAENVVRELHLDTPGRVQEEGSGLAATIRNTFRTLLFSPMGNLLGSGRDDKAFEAAVEQLRKDLIIEPNIDSHIVSISYRSVSPTVACEVVNKVVAEYLRQHLSINLNRTEGSFYAEQSAKVEGEIKGLQEELARIKSEEGIVSLAEQNSLMLKKYETFDLARTTLQKEIIARRSKIEKVRELKKKDPNVLIPLPEIARDPIVQDLENSIVNLRFQVKNLNQRYTDTTPQVANAREQIKQLENQIRAQVDQYLDREEVELEKLQTEENALTLTLQELGLQIKRLPGIEISLSSLQKQIDDKTTALTQLRNKYQDSLVGQAADSRLENVKIVSQASVPLHPVAPKILLNTVLGFIMALVVSISMAMFLEYLDDSLKVPEDVEHYLDGQVLASIPEL